MKAYKNQLTRRTGFSLREKPCLTGRREIMSREQGMRMLEVLNIIVQYFLYYEGYGTLNHEDTKARRHRENRVGITRIVEIKIYIRKAAGKLFSLFMGFCPGKINTSTMQKKLQAMASRYQRIPGWINLVINQTREEPFGLLRPCSDKKIGIAPVPGAWTSNMLNKIFLRHEILLTQAKGMLHGNNYLQKNLLSQFFNAVSQPRIAYRRSLQLIADS